MIGEISTLLGLKVYTDEGRYVGVVKDLVLDVENRRIKSLAISDYNKTLINSKAKGVLIPYRLVKAVGDIVIVKDVFKAKKEED
ncbi:PRC-barrel domain-containing protein [Archaeoglobus profundus]|uniref:PRC-barrel domain protein n=1 Tax=Archaeoglobus profundus (strain DSM 5631 / JCM 9629 / NBRC 100127 / Av18) TaxID=572546 RepID=D2RF84_ARCPA|nr:PRC-barrel domain-containing protein [Archaeoglobus profundus]ADB58778.1 PRC-barrel domain protein [Archaeoglobus profundus DSM 5631]